MKTLTAIAALICATPALADPGHLVDVAGHDHLVAGIALGIAVGVGLWAALKGKGKSKPEVDIEEDPETDQEPQEA